MAGMEDSQGYEVDASRESSGEVNFEIGRRLSNIGISLIMLKKTLFIAFVLIEQLALAGGFPKPSADRCEFYEELEAQLNCKKWVAPLYLDSLT